MDGDGFQEYQRRTPKGAENQGWKDSGNGVLYENGDDVPAPKALCELQGYVYDAWLRMASIYDALNQAEKAVTLRRKAKVLYALAKNSPGTYMTSGTPAMQNLSMLYPSSGYHDELGWAALWLFQATNDSSFLADATGMFAAVQADANAGSGFQVRPPSAILRTLVVLSFPSALEACPVA